MSTDNFRNRTFLVTGGGGFIGSHLTDSLVHRGAAVRILDNFATGRRANLAHLPTGRVELVEGDIRDAAVLRRACAGVDTVFHQAAIPSVPRSISEPELNHDVNVNGTLNVLLAARDTGVRRLVYAASSSAYGEISDSAKIEDQLPQPLSPYAVAKLTGEYYCQVFAREYGLETVALRYFNIFGPRQDPSSPYSGVISKFVTTLLEGQPPTIHGDGEQSRDFAYVENVVDANIRAAESSTAIGSVINVGTGQRTTLNQLLAELQRIVETSLAPVYGPPRAGDVRHSYADLTRATALLGYRPLVDLATGLRQTVDWYRRGATA